MSVAEFGRRICSRWFRLVPHGRSGVSTPVENEFHRRVQGGCWPVLCNECVVALRLTNDERLKFVSGEFFINVHGFLGVLGAYVSVVLRGDSPRLASDQVLLQGGINAAVHWTMRCRGGAAPMSGALMRLLGVGSGRRLVL